MDRRTDPKNRGDFFRKLTFSSKRTWLSLLFQALHIPSLFFSIMFSTAATTTTTMTACRCSRRAIHLANRRRLMLGTKRMTTTTARIISSAQQQRLTTTTKEHHVPSSSVYSITTQLLQQPHYFSTSVDKQQQQQQQDATKEPDNKKKSQETLEETVRRMSGDNSKDDERQDSSSSSSSDFFRTTAVDYYDRLQHHVREAWRELVHSGRPKDINKKVLSVVHPHATSEGEKPYDGVVDIMVIDESEHLTAWERMQKRLTEAPIIQGTSMYVCSANQQIMCTLTLSSLVYRHSQQGRGLVRTEWCQGGQTAARSFVRRRARSLGDVSESMGLSGQQRLRYLDAGIGIRRGGAGIAQAGSSLHFGGMETRCRGTYVAANHAVVLGGTDQSIETVVGGRCVQTNCGGNYRATTRRSSN
jgi:hypothetical protein